MECVPNFSEGRDLQKIDKIVAPFRSKQGVKLLDYSNDEDHNRLVVTVVGEPEPLRDAVLEAIGVAVELIDLNHHQGQHPRMGAVDVVPFIPIRNVTMEEAVALSKEVGEEVAKRYNLPVFLYEKSASAPHRENLAAVRKGEFEGMAEKIKQPEWHPDFGPAERHPTAGTVAIGARMPLVAYNINLNTPSLEIAHDIAKKIRFIGGGLRYCKAMGVELKDRGITQVSINMTDYTRTALYRAFELVRVEARRYGVSIVGSEIIGLDRYSVLLSGIGELLHEPSAGSENYGIRLNTNYANYTNLKEMVEQEEVDEILKAFYTVYNTLGYGFLERVYQNALYVELKQRGFNCETQKKIEVYYKNQVVGEYYADMVVNGNIILELKAADCLCVEHEYQLINYLRSTNIEIGYLLNFGKHATFKRKIYTNDKKSDKK